MTYVQLFPMCVRQAWQSKFRVCAFQVKPCNEITQKKKKKKRRSRILTLNSTNEKQDSSFMIF